MFRRLLDESGETLVETLCSILVITMAMLFLAYSLIGASRANTAVDADDVSFVVEDVDFIGDGVVHFEGTGVSDVSVDVELFETGGGYAYYDVKE